MRGSTTRMFFSALASLILVATAWTLSAAATHNGSRHLATNGQESAQTQSVSGKIASIEKNSFTLTVGLAHTAKQGLQMQEAAPKTMTFVIDKNTTVDGKLQVGANADVTYREDGGKNVAISVRVSS
jgi:hypothetical protein